MERHVSFIYFLYKCWFTNVLFFSISLRLGTTKQIHWINLSACAYHPILRAPSRDILDGIHFYHPSPAYAKRFQKHNETECPKELQMASAIIQVFHDGNVDTHQVCLISLSQLFNLI